MPGAPRHQPGVVGSGLTLSKGTGRKAGEEGLVGPLGLPRIGQVDVHTERRRPRVLEVALGPGPERRPRRSRRPLRRRGGPYQRASCRVVEGRPVDDAGGVRPVMVRDADDVVVGGRHKGLVGVRGRRVSVGL